MSNGCSMEEKIQLEKKILTLEQRLVLVERFVEMRFCESFRDFSIRNLSNTPLNKDNKDIVAANPVIVSPIPGPRSKKVGRKPKLPSSCNIPAPAIVIRQPALDLESEGEEPAEAEPEPITYQTRSGRTTKRLTATALGAVRSTSTPKYAESESPGKPKGRGGEKILKVSLTRLRPKEQAKNADEFEDTEVDVSIVKVAQDSEGEQEDDGTNDESTDYFTYPAEDEHEEVDEQEVHSDNDDGDGGNLDDGDWSASGEGMEEEMEEADIEYKPTKGKSLKSPRKRVSQQLESPSSSVTKRTRGRKRRVESEPKTKIWPPSKIDMLSDGVQLQMLKPDETKLKECPICRKHLKPQAYDSHVEWHGKERHLKCSVCDKRFFSEIILRRHKKLHQIEKYGKKCRLCGKISTDSYKQLKHEGFCIKKRLEGKIHVPPEIMEDVRSRSKHLELKWPDPNAEKAPMGKKMCKYCNEYVPEKGFNTHIKEQHCRWQCHLCENKYVEKGGLVRHLLHIHGQCSKLTCDWCDSEFGSTEEYKEHAVKCRQKNKKSSSVASRTEQVEEQNLFETDVVHDVINLEVVSLPTESTPIVIQEFTL